MWTGTYHISLCVCVGGGGGGEGGELWYVTVPCRTG